MSGINIHVYMPNGNYPVKKKKKEKKIQRQEGKEIIAKVQSLSRTQMADVALDEVVIYGPS